MKVDKKATAIALSKSEIYKIVPELETSLKALQEPNNNFPQQSIEKVISSLNTIKTVMPIP
jgi:hypothetical protein